LIGELCINGAICWKSGINQTRGEVLLMDENKTKEQLLLELSDLRERVAELESLRKQQEQVENALRLSEEKFSKAFHCSPDITTIATLHEGRYVEINDAFLKTVGFERSEVIDHTIQELGVWAIPEERELVLKHIAEHGSLRNYEMHFRDKSKEIFTTLLSADKIDIGGEPHLLCVVKDISDRKRMVAALQLSEERFSKAFKASPITMSITTLEEGLFLDVNASFCRVIGISREEVIGMTSEDIRFWVNPADRDRVKQLILEQGSVIDMEVQFRRRTGEIRLGSYSAERLMINGEVCLLSIFNDLTERRQMDIEISRLDRLNLVGEMAASIAHEIRNPMTTVRGYLQILRDNEDYINEVEFFDLMIEELDRANMIITEFLSLAKNKVVELKPHNLNTILKTFLPLLKANAMIHDKGIILQIENIPDLLLDEKEIRQLIHNLVNNALESIPAGRNVNIKTFLDNEQVVLAVQDEGDGIDHRILDKLGTPFFTTKDHGTGLGLAVCYGIASRHNARIDLETSSIGTTFFVRFPLSTHPDLSKIII